ncbi:uridylate kinase PUMPKIN, chloroplastic [Mercurialis annua]|uniref:uridylate kinase PUMPKIN, chloroplastic n=1 Tax=Mercurialis annua TaxID=3986 RepID=UPI00215DFCFC|nr:uridylate kinase PUMPKIN, chloroplastic [Mercurialis annua]
MASCDDDFALLTDDNHHPHHHQTNPNHHILHHQTYAPHRFPAKSPPIHAPPQSLAAGAGSTACAVEDPEEEAEEEEDNESDSPFPEVNPFSDNNSNPFSDNNSNLRTATTTEKRRETEDNNSDGCNNINDNNINNDIIPYTNSYKKPRQNATSSSSEYRKDREEWSDAAIECLLDAYMEKFMELNRGNLRGRDWEEVAVIVSERCQKQSKTVEQCKNKVDNLKKRYKLERHRMSNGGLSASHWPWFKKMEEIVGNSLTVKVVSSDDFRSGSGGSSGSGVRPSKRYATALAIPASQTATVKSKSICNTRWRRVVLKISGVALAGTGPNNIDPKVMMLIAREVAIACRLGIEVAIVVGGRNFFCGDAWVTATGSDRRTAYQIGMMASVMNSILLQSALEKAGVQTRVQTAFTVQEVAEPYNRQRAIRHLEKGRVVIFGGIGAGTGNPLFSTDTAAALQASEIHAEAVLKGTNVDGVYDCHSRDNNVTFEHISFRDLVSRGATSMDMMALTCCEENGIPAVVFNLLEPGNISKALCGEQVGTLIDQTGSLS